MTATPAIPWPDGKSFAFSVFDDTDRQTMANVKPVYDLLTEVGMRTTKSVWVFDGEHPEPSTSGVTCADPEYLAWTRQLQSLGFEIGFHNATYHTSPRSVTRAAVAAFEDMYGHAPRSLANHDWNRESIYWGDARVTGPRRLAYNAMTLFRRASVFEGHVEGSPFFWGDICKDHLDYVRNFVFDDINTLRACPFMPYADPAKPYVRRWFASSEGSTLAAFTRTIAAAHQDRLEDEGGACVMYTHFADGFVRGGRVDPTFARRIERLAGKNGWFVPVSTLLDHILHARGEHVITRKERTQLERRWLMDSIRIRLRR